MKRKLFSILTAMILCLSICPTQAFASDNEIPNSETLCRNWEDGAMTLSGGALAVEGGTLTGSESGLLPASRERVVRLASGTFAAGEFELDLSVAGSAVTDKWETEGYKWENVETGEFGDIISGTLTLAPGFGAAKVTLPDAAVTVVTEGDSDVGILTPGDAGAYNMNLTFSGTGTLTVAGHIEISGGNNNSLTVDADAELVANNGISIGAGSVDGAVTVNGTLRVEQGSGISAIYAGKVAVGDAGVLEVSGEQGVQLNGMTESGIVTFNNLFNVTGNGRFTADCSDYNVMVQAAGSFPEGTTAQGSISLTAEYMPEDCTLKLEGTAINLVRKSDGSVYSGALTIHKNHSWSSAWTDGGEDTHYHACAYPGCTAKESDSESPHYYAHGADACRDCNHPRPEGAPDSDSSDSDHNSSYTVTVEKADHGEVTANPGIATRGDTVTLTVTPDSGYELTALTVTDSWRNDIALTEKDGGYTFTMPDQTVTVRAVFSSSACAGGADCPSREFSDLDTGEWYHEAVDYVLKNGLLSGYGSGLFGPNDTLSRAQFAQIIYNNEGKPAVTGGSAFTDVAPDAWYAPAVTWAASQGIVEGYGDGRFGPEEPITREQLAVVLWRYAGCPNPPNLLLDFSDADSASSYALDALRWAVDKGIITGKGDGVLDPKGNADRAETSAMLMRYLSR